MNIERCLFSTSISTPAQLKAIFIFAELLVKASAKHNKACRFDELGICLRVIRGLCQRQTEWIIQIVLEGQRVMTIRL